MWQLLLVLVVIGVGIWLMRRGGCCGMGKREDKDATKGPGRSCH
jgi:hypothetical protein